MGPSPVSYVTLSYSTSRTLPLLLHWDTWKSRELTPGLSSAPVLLTTTLNCSFLVGPHDSSAGWLIFRRTFSHQTLTAEAQPQGREQARLTQLHACASSEAGAEAEAQPFLAVKRRSVMSCHSTGVALACGSHPAGQPVVSPSNVAPTREWALFWKPRYNTEADTGDVHWLTRTNFYILLGGAAGLCI